MSINGLNNENVLSYLGASGTGASKIKIVSELLQDCSTIEQLMQQAKDELSTATVSKLEEYVKQNYKAPLPEPVVTPEPKIETVEVPEPVVEPIVEEPIVESVVGYGYPNTPIATQTPLNNPKSKKSNRR